MFHLYDPSTHLLWFPTINALVLHNVANNYHTTLGSYFSPTMFSGVLNWWYLITVIIFSIVYAVVDVALGYLQNGAWNVLTEFLFLKRKTKLYQKELSKKNQDFVKLNTQYRALAEQAHSLKDSVITDEMTQVFNKRFFLSRLEQEFDVCRKEKATLSLIMIDIDFFKKLNDNYGHLAGDTVLKTVATVLKRFTPEQCFACRYGGEEFSIIMPHKGYREALEAARLFQENIQLLQFPEIDRKLRVTVSQGVCSVSFGSPESMTIKHKEQLLELTDQQLYRSKMEGRNRVSVHSWGNPQAPQ